MKLPSCIGETMSMTSETSGPKLLIISVMPMLQPLNKQSGDRINHSTAGESVLFKLIYANEYTKIDFGIDV